MLNFLWWKTDGLTDWCTGVYPYRHTARQMDKRDPLHVTITDKKMSNTTESVFKRFPLNILRTTTTHRHIHRCFFCVWFFCEKKKEKKKAISQITEGIGIQCMWKRSDGDGCIYWLHWGLVWSHSENAKHTYMMETIVVFSRMAKHPRKSACILGTLLHRTFHKTSHWHTRCWFNWLGCLSQPQYS